MLRALFAVVMAMAVSTTAAWAVAPDGQEEICNSPAVIFCDNFEARALGSGDLGRTIYKNPGWALSQFNNLLVSDTDKFDGSKSLEFRYPSGGGGIGFMDTPLSSLTELYFRWYEKWSASWTWSPIATKNLATLTSGPAAGRAPWILHSTWGTADLHHIYEPTQTSYPQNVGTIMSFANNVWYCMEIHLKMNTGGLSNGILEGWVDGVQKWNYSNADFGGAGNTWTSLLVSGYWNCISPTCSDPQDQHSAMSRWHDNLVVSAQPIGCLTDTTPPLAPSGLTVR